MPRPYSSGVVPASAADVWQLVRQFNGLATWHPAIKHSVIEGSASPQDVGAVRRLTLADDSQVAERLLTLSDDDRSLTYAFVDPGPMPVRSYKATVRVSPVTSTGQAFVEWWGWFDSEAAVEEQMNRTCSETVYGAGIAALVERFQR